jgi:hypothetical protein
MGYQTLSAAVALPRGRGAGAAPVLFTAVLGVLTLAWAASAVAATAGIVQFTSGSAAVTRADGTSRPLANGLEIRNGDLVDTGTGRVQLRFSDGALVSLQPESQFRIDDYRFEGRADGSEKGFFSLLKGGLRTVSGWIGRVHRAGYRIDTPTATIGIRGTEYTAVLGNSLTVSVAEGRIALINDAGEFLLDAGRTAFVKDRRTLPVIVSERPFLPPSGAQPAMVSFQPEPYTGGDNLQGEVLTALAALSESGASFAPGTLPVIAPVGSEPPVVGGGNPLPPPPPPPGGGSDPPGGGTRPPALKGIGAFAGEHNGEKPPVYPGAAEFVQPFTRAECDSNGACTSFFAPAGIKIDRVGGQAVDTVTGKPDHGFDGVIGWGRWIDYKSTGVIKPVGDAKLTDGQGLHYVFGTPTEKLPEFAKVGVYTLVGATQATSTNAKELGGLGQFVPALTASELLPGQRLSPDTVMVVDFTNPRVDLGFKVTFPGAGYGVATAGPQAIKGTTMELSGAQLRTDGCAGNCQSAVGGFFAGPNAERAGIVYRIDDPARATVHGAAALQQAAPPTAGVTQQDVQQLKR